MSVLGNLGMAFASNLTQALASNYASKLYNYGANIASLPLYKNPENVSVQPEFNPTKLIGIDDGNWSRRDQRRFRKNAGMSKLEFRNWKADLMGVNRQGENMSRKDIRNVINKIDSTYGSGYSNNLITNSWIEQALNNWNKLHQPILPQVPITNVGIIQEEIEEEPLPNEVDYSDQINDYYKLRYWNSNPFNYQWTLNTQIPQQETYPINLYGYTSWDLMPANYTFISPYQVKWGI